MKKVKPTPPPAVTRAWSDKVYGQCALHVTWSAMSRNPQDVVMYFVRPSDPERWSSTPSWQNDTQVNAGGNGRDCGGTFYYKLCAKYHDADEACTEQASVSAPAGG